MHRGEIFSWEGNKSSLLQISKSLKNSSIQGLVAFVSYNMETTSYEYYNTSIPKNKTRFRQPYVLTLTLILTLTLTLTLTLEEFQILTS